MDFVSNFARLAVTRLYVAGWIFTVAILMLDEKGDLAGAAYWTFAFPIDVLIGAIWPVYWSALAVDVFFLR